MDIIYVLIHPIRVAFHLLSFSVVAVAVPGNVNFGKIYIVIFELETN